MIEKLQSSKKDYSGTKLDGQQKNKNKNKPMLFHRSSLERQQLNTYGYATWKSYAKLRMKAVEQQFTWSEFVVSLSIAFLFVMSSSYGLNTIYENALKNTQNQSSLTHKILIESSRGVNQGYDFTC